ncbi:hypothetical protein B1F79_05065 [Coxiella-like endosymbiont of Rhipicephalus sanguineus]|uniref:hypothetical protein n=1 Tax=Coxiella-like endosymbiont of Rhipicephalus sanguineus TaxID=1955402 RepID=UPI00204261E0|nr:hypothetical protein [Coxiella-like endosymbiont of Rhipicephalus sanguineus]MBT8506782.1 hypothetical protein [Coxiella-like endosymbiont of Rhipicephalus sanguineus]
MDTNKAILILQGTTFEESPHRKFSLTLIYVASLVIFVERQYQHSGNAVLHKYRAAQNDDCKH